jgi:hypothetical protein
MPVTPLTIEGRAVVGRMRDFPNTEGNAQWLQQLVYQDSATVSALIPELAAVVPAVAEPVTQGLYRAAATCGTALECGGHLGMWPLMASAATELETALTAIEGYTPAENPEPPQPETAP